MIRQNEPFVNRSDDLAPGATPEGAMGDAMPLAMSDGAKIALPHGVPLAMPVEQSDADEEIYCPICGYNLTGILSGRCPECGSLFNRAALIAVQKLHAISLIPWDDPEPMGVRDRFWRTLKICLFQPDRFAHAFSVQPQKSNVATFWWASVMLLGASYLIMSGIQLFLWFYEDPTQRLLESDRVSTTFLLLVGLPLIATAAAMILTALAWAVTLAALCPHFDCQRHFKPWFSIACYSSTHFLLVPVWIICVAPIIWLSFGSGGVYIVGLLIGGFGCSLLNFATIWGVVKHRTVQDTASWVTFLLLVAEAVGMTIAAVVGSCAIMAFV